MKIVDVLLVIVGVIFIIGTIYGVATAEEPVNDRVLLARIDSLHTVQMKKLNRLDSLIVKYNVNVEIGMLDFLSAETISLMENADEK